MDYDLIVIGGGISGLTFARRGAAHGWRTLLLEAEPRVGGCLATQRFDGEAAGFWAELGAHTAYNSYGALLELLDPELIARMQPRRQLPWRVWDGQRLQSVFARMHWPTLLPALPRLFTQPKAGLSLRDYYSRVMGRRTYDDLLRHAFNAVIAQPADDFPADLLFRKKPRRKDIPRSYTFDGGLATLVEGLVGQGVETRTGGRVEAVTRAAEGFVVTAAEGELPARRLALAVPAWEAARLLAADQAELSAVLARIAPAEVESLAVVVSREAVRLPEVSGLIAIDQAYYSAVSRDVVADANWRGLTFHFRPGRLGQDDKLALVAQVLGIEIGQIATVAGRVSRLPALKVGHAGLIEAIDAALAGQPLALTGNYFQGVAIGDCAERSRAEFERIARN